jgi:hypothetical protein
VGLLNAFIFGIGIQSSGHALAALGIKRSPETTAVHPVFAPEFALLGFVFGALVGGGIGALWKRGPLRHAVASVLITCVGALVGIAAVGLFGAETRTTVRDGFVRVDHGASDEALLVGAIAGVALGACLAWGLSRIPTSPDLDLLLGRPLPHSQPRKSRKIVGYVLAGTIALLLFLVSLWQLPQTFQEGNRPATIAGTWASDWGQVTLFHAPIEDGEPTVVSGFYMMGENKGSIMRGTFDPRDRALEFLFSEPRNNLITGSAKLQLSGNGNKLEGTWTNSAGESGIWTMIRIVPDD